MSPASEAVYVARVLLRHFGERQAAFDYAKRHGSKLAPLAPLYAAAAEILRTQAKI